MVEARERTKMREAQLKLVEAMEASATVYATRTYDSALQLQHSSQSDAANHEANQAAKDWVEQQERKTSALHALAPQRV